MDILSDKTTQNGMNKEPVTLPKGQKIIFDKGALEWECPYGCQTTDGFTELTNGYVWLTQFCTKSLEHSVERIVKDYPEMAKLIKQPFSFLAYG